MGYANNDVIWCSFWGIIFLLLVYVLKGYLHEFSRKSKDNIIEQLRKKLKEKYLSKNMKE